MCSRRFFSTIVMVFLVTGSANIAAASGAVKIDQDRINALKKDFHCHKKPASRACAVLDVFLGAGTPKETSLNGKRMIQVGYTLDENGKVIEQLGFIEYRYSKNFHRKVHFPNKICATHVVATKPGEDKIISDAITSLKLGKIPRKNPAYVWAGQYDWRRKGLCGGLEYSRAAGGTVSPGAGWHFRYKNGKYFLIAYKWNGKSRPFVMMY